MEQTVSDHVSDSSTPPPGWYPDPWFHGQRRYWTGTEWTADVFVESATPAASATPPPMPPPSAHAPLPPPPPEWGSSTPLPPPAPAWPAPAAATAISSDPPRFPWRLAIGILAGALALALLAVWALQVDDSSDSAGAAPSPNSSPTAPSSPSDPSAPASPSAPAPTGSALLEALVVRQQDVSSDYLVSPIPGGTEVQGEVTLDLCKSATYPSEDARRDRLQVAAISTLGEVTLSTEAVRYGSEADTAQAFDEVRASATACSTEPVVDPITGESTTTAITTDADRAWSRTEGVDRLAYTVTTTNATTGEIRTSVVVYLRRGDILLGLYFPKPEGEQMAVEGTTTIPGIVTIFEKRLLNPPTDTITSGGGSVPA